MYVLEKGVSQELKDLHYNDNERIGQIVITGEEGIVIVKDEEDQKKFTASKLTSFFLPIPFSTSYT